MNIISIRRNKKNRLEGGEKNGLKYMRTLEQVEAYNVYIWIASSVVIARDDVLLIMSVIRIVSHDMAPRSPDLYQQIIRGRLSRAKSINIKVHLSYEIN